MKRSEKPVPCDDVVSANEYTGSAQGMEVTDEQVRKHRKQYHTD